MKFAIFVSFFLMVFSICVSAKDSGGLATEHEVVIDSFLDGFGVKKSSITGFKRSQVDLMKEMEGSWQGKPVIESCLSSALAPEVQYKEIVLESFKSSYDLEEARAAAEETETKFTKEFLNLIFLASVMGDNPSKKLIKHANENKEAYQRFEANIQPKKMKFVQSVIQPATSKIYYSNIVNDCIAENS